MKEESKHPIISAEFIESSIYLIRGCKEMLDADLAQSYGVQTRVLNQAVRRNIERFPIDFMFQLSIEELEHWKSQFVISNPKIKMSLRKRSLAFTEQGVAMLSSVLRSPQAITVNIEIMRIFVKMRHVFASHKKLSKEVEEIKSFLLKNSQHNKAEFKKVWQAIDSLANPPEEERKIGFKLPN